MGLFELKIGNIQYIYVSQKQASRPELANNQHLKHQFMHH